MSADPDLALAQHALAQGWLPREQLREALLLREQLRAGGRAADLGQVLAAGYLRPEHTRELLARRGAAPRGEPIPPTALARAADLAQRPADADPPAVRELLAALADFGARATVSLTPAAPAPDPGPRPAPPGPPGPGPSLPTALPRRLGVFELGRELGRGGMGAVFAAHHPGLDRPVAIKVVLGWDPGRLRRFQVEARTTARLRHPNIVGIHEVGVEQGHPYLVMDFVEGEPLSARLEREGPLEPRAAARLAATLARALDYAHRRGVLHRDLKPSNVLLDAEGAPVLTDFGLAKELAAGESLTRTGQLVGTPAYMPPEQARGDKERIDARSDVYALGATLYELLAGQPPFVGSSAMEVVVAAMHRAPAPPSRARPRAAGPLDPRLEALVLRCLEKDPAARPPSALALAEALEAWLGEGAAGAAAAAPPRSAAAPLAVAAAAVAAAGVLGGLLFAERRAEAARAGARAAAAEVLARLGSAAPGADDAAALARALALDPALDDARAALAEAALAGAQPEAARALLDAAPGPGAPSPRLGAARARLALAAGRHDEALALLEGTPAAAAGPAAHDLALARAAAADARGWTATAEAARWDALRADPTDGGALAGIVRARLAALDAGGLARLWEGLHDRLGRPGEPTLLEAARADEATLEAALRDRAAPPRLRLRAAIAAARHRRPAVVEALRAVVAEAGAAPLLVEAARASLLVTGRLAPDGLPDALAGGRDLGRWAEAATPAAEAEGAAQALTLLERAARLGADDRGALLRLGREARGALLRTAVPLALAIAGSREGGLPPDAARGLLDGLAAAGAPEAARAARAARAALLALDGEAPAEPEAAPALRLAAALLALPGPRRDVRAGARARAALEAAARAAPGDAALAALRLEDALARGDLAAARAAAGAAAGDPLGAELGAQLAALLDPTAPAALPPTLAGGDPAARADAAARVSFARRFALPALPGADGAVRAVLAGGAPWAARALRDGLAADQPGPDERPLDAGARGVLSLRTRWRCAAWHHLEVDGARDPGKAWATLDAADAREVETGIRAEWDVGGALANVALDSYELARRERGRPLAGRTVALSLERGAVVVREDGEALVDAPLPARVARGGGRAYLDWSWAGGRIERLVLEGRWAPDAAPAAPPPDLRARLAALVPVAAATPTISRAMGDGNAMPDVAALRRMGQLMEARFRWVADSHDASFVGVGGLRGDVEVRARLRFPAGAGQAAGLALRAAVPRGDVVWLTFGDAPARTLAVNTQRETYWSRPIFVTPWAGDAEVTLALARVGDVVVARHARGDGPLRDVGPGVFDVPFSGPVDALLYAADWLQKGPYPTASFDRIEVLVPPP